MSDRQAVATLELTTGSEEETRRLASAMGPSFRPGDIISLTGDLGAGKTRFTQGLAAGLGVEGQVTSPTFTIIKTYSGRLPLYHFDVYRLSGPREMEPLGYEEYFYGDGVTVVEWGDRIAELLPPDHLRIELHRALEEMNERLLLIQAFGPRARALMAVLMGSK